MTRRYRLIAVEAEPSLMPADAVAAGRILEERPTFPRRQERLLKITNRALFADKRLTPRRDIVDG